VQPLTPEERQRLIERAQLKRRLTFSQNIGNYRADTFQMQQTLTRSARQYLSDQGVPGEFIAMAAPMYAPPPGRRGTPTIGEVKVFALLLEFNDMPHANSQQTIHTALFGSPAAGAPYESLAAYYKRASYDLLDLSGGATLGWYKVNKNRAQVSKTALGREAIIKEALTHFQNQGHDFSQYDNDNNGVIDYFMVFWTGPDTGWSSFWWGYQTSFIDPLFKVSGKRLSKYSWQWEANPAGSVFHPRVVIHETGHALGLPDLYDYDSNVGPDGGVGGADMMDANQYDHNCFHKWMLDWLTPTIVGSGVHQLTLGPSGTTQDCVAIWPSLDAGEIFSEMFMVQNRQPVANDSRLPGSGLMIWHVDASLNPSGKDFGYNNSFTEHKYVRLMEADGREEIEMSRGFNVGDYYVPGSSFGPATTPSSQKYDGQSSTVEVLNITRSGSNISLEIRVGEALSYGKQLAPARNKDGRLELIFSGLDDVLYNKWQTQPNSGWGGKAVFGGSAKQIVTARNKNGRLEVFYTGTDDALYHNVQTVSNDGWAGETAFGGSARTLAVAANQDGCLEVFYVGLDDLLYHNRQLTPNGSWSGESAFGGSARQVAVARNKDGRLQVFYIGTDDLLYHNWQTQPNNGWQPNSGWLPNGNWNGQALFGGSAKQLAVGQRKNGRLEIFYVGLDDALYHRWQTNWSNAWSSQAALGASAKRLAVTANKDGRLELFYIATDESLCHTWQKKPNAGWSPPESFGVSARQAAVAANKDGRLELFYVGSNDALYHRWQTTPNNGWGAEYPI
jgi:M6 family metalloprotease-like protein